jgi:succinate dehydrogenase assembly factor 2
VYQTRKRGWLEGDLLLATFARDRLGGMGVDEMREFDKVRTGLL